MAEMGEDGMPVGWLDHQEDDLVLPVERAPEGYRVRLVPHALLAADWRSQAERVARLGKTVLEAAGEMSLADYGRWRREVDETLAALLELKLQTTAHLQDHQPGAPPAPPTAGLSTGAPTSLDAHRAARALPAAPVAPTVKDSLEGALAALRGIVPPEDEDSSPPDAGRGAGPESAVQTQFSLLAESPDAPALSGDF